MFPTFTSIFQSFVLNQLWSQSTKDEGAKSHGQSKSCLWKGKRHISPEPWKLRVGDGKVLWWVGMGRYNVHNYMGWKCIETCCRRGFKRFLWLLFISFQWIGWSVWERDANQHVLVCKDWPFWCLPPCWCAASLMIAQTGRAGVVG